MAARPRCQGHAVGRAARRRRPRRVLFFGRVPAGAEPHWWPDWRQQAALPTLIRLAIAGPGGAWPDLVVTPRLGRPVESGPPSGGRAVPARHPLSVLISASEYILTGLAVGCPKLALVNLRDCQYRYAAK